MLTRARGNPAPARPRPPRLWAAVHRQQPPCLPEPRTGNGFSGAAVAVFVPAAAASVLLLQVPETPESRVGRLGPRLSTL